MNEIKFPDMFAINIDNLEAVKRDDCHIWGYEVWLVNDYALDLAAKFLIIFPGFLSSQHAHKPFVGMEDLCRSGGKDEYFIVLDGELKLHVWPCGLDYDVEIVELTQGQRYFIPKGTYHRFETGSKDFVLLLEVSTYEDEQTDKPLPSERLLC